MEKDSYQRTSNIELVRAPQHKHLLLQQRIPGVDGQHPVLVYRGRPSDDLPERAPTFGEWMSVRALECVRASELLHTCRNRAGPVSRARVRRRIL